jgi:hypothetical protein
MTRDEMQRLFDQHRDAELARDYDARPMMWAAPSAMT